VAPPHPLARKGNIMGKDFLDPGLFSDAISAIDLHNNMVRQRLRGFDAFGGRTVFEAIVLSKPIFLADAQTGAESSTFSQASVEEGRLACKRAMALEL